MKTKKVHLFRGQMRAKRMLAKMIAAGTEAMGQPLPLHMQNELTKLVADYALPLLVDDEQQFDEAHAAEGESDA